MSTTIEEFWEFECVKSILDESSEFRMKDIREDGTLRDDDIDAEGGEHEAMESL
jgi:hypothetical protein